MVFALSSSVDLVWAATVIQLQLLAMPLRRRSPFSGMDYWNEWIIGMPLI